MCKCGCNTCETKGPLLTESKVKSLISEGLQYHIDKNIPLFETVYRIGSDKHLSLIKAKCLSEPIRYTVSNKGIFLSI